MKDIKNTNEAETITGGETWLDFVRGVGEDRITQENRHVKTKDTIDTAGPASSMQTPQSGARL